MNLVVGDDEHAAATGVGMSGDGDGVVEIHRAVGADFRGRAHRADEDDRFGAGDDEIQEVAGLLHRVGAVRDDDGGDVGVGEGG